MDATTIEQTLRTMIVERLYLTVEPAALDADAPLMQTYGIDSVCFLELVVGMEELFGITLEDGDFSVKNFRTLAAMRNFVCSRLGA